ncbi:MAG: RHS repeat-associated core domain-containing protein, partial [Pirellulaceae bacterium]|nr:RHS repeat-associated core domain-containing protein [Pirellulaceae bacterium]
MAGSGGERLFTISDALGSVTGLLGTQPGAKGQVVTRFAYDPYGAHDQVGGEFGWNHLFAGYYFDRETGLYHVRRRFYHAGLGRWLQHDPLGDVDSPNLYEYVASNPLGNVDPTGEIIPFLVGVGLGVALVGVFAAKFSAEDMLEAANRGDQAGFNEAQQSFNASTLLAVTGL